MTNKYPLEQAKEFAEIIASCSQNRCVVTHVDGSTKYKPTNYGVDSWMEVWENKMLEKYGKVPALNDHCDCCGKDEVERKRYGFDGAHVADSAGKMYIYPVCSTCNLKAKAPGFEHKFFCADKNKLAEFDELKDRTDYKEYIRRFSDLSDYRNK